jgi:hypothetical protein
MLAFLACVALLFLRCWFLAARFAPSRRVFSLRAARFRPCSLRWALRWLFRRPCSFSARVRLCVLALRSVRRF